MQRTSLAPLHPRSATTACALPPFVNAPTTIASANEPPLQQRASAPATIIRAPPAALQRAPPPSSLQTSAVPRQPPLQQQLHHLHSRLYLQDSYQQRHSSHGSHDNRSFTTIFEQEPRRNPSPPQFRHH
ncbi:hypothetical protein DEO72_LG2g3147 [Vigna unguiculata]|uniref:Uncharacterized protein n=1 Tax=Vigna unguiculata TaxID=3917 RepID=A0A4D6L2W0_VIGUN|nr:hypothetical protein DEO72_LG2g3147 [Vigna unguiculata]